MHHVHTVCHISTIAVLSMQNFRWYLIPMKQKPQNYHLYHHQHHHHYNHHHHDGYHHHNLKYCYTWTHTYVAVAHLSTSVVIDLKFTQWENASVTFQIHVDISCQCRCHGSMTGNCDRLTTPRVTAMAVTDLGAREWAFLWHVFKLMQSHDEIGQTARFICWNKDQGILILKAYSNHLCCHTIWVLVIVMVTQRLFALLLSLSANFICPNCCPGKH